MKFQIRGTPWLKRVNRHTYGRKLTIFYSDSISLIVAIVIIT